jgi:TonB family protein
MTEAQAQSEVRTVGFVFVSSVLHVLLAVGILALKAEQTPPKETIQIEILGGSELLSAPAGAQAKAAALPSVAKTPVSEAPKAAKQAQAPILSAKSTAKEMTKDDIVAPNPKLAPVAAAKTTATPAHKITEVKAAPAPVAADAPLETAELDEPKNLSAAPEQELNTEELNKDFEQTNQESDVKVAALQKNLSEDADSALKEQDEQTKKLQAQTAAENAAIAKQIADQKAKAQAQQAVLAQQEAARQQQAQADAESAAAAAVAADQAKADQEAADKAAKLAAEKADADRVAAAQLASEQAAQNKAAKERMLAAKAAAEKSEADKLAAEQAAEARAQQAAAEAAAKAQAQADAQKGSGGGGGGVAANEVRSLNELRQKPGNEHPIYDSDDRFHGRQGDVSFLAYISKEGAPVKFKMLQSSGFRELDAKTLKAIRNWKFYPGQEGWVEIPFRWDLKGGPQEMPATLRRKISQSN